MPSKYKHRNSIKQIYIYAHIWKTCFAWLQCEYVWIEAPTNCTVSNWIWLFVTYIYITNWNWSPVYFPQIEHKYCWNVRQSVRLFYTKMTEAIQMQTKCPNILYRFVRSAHLDIHCQKQKKILENGVFKKPI